jgi:putative inorganic carbon (hco3(-)) transporter
MTKLLNRFLQFPSSFERPSQIWIFVALAGSIASALVSIAASQILLAIALIGWLATVKRQDIKWISKLPFIPPLVAFFLWTIATALISPNSVSSLVSAKKFFLFSILFLVPAIVRGRGRLLWIYKAIFVFSAMAGVSGISQYLANTNRDLLHRISGFMSHWMTYSGLLMLVLVLLISYALNIRWRDRPWAIALCCLICAAIILSETRNVWVGAIAGSVLVILLKQPRAIFSLLAIVLALYIVSPARIKQRLQTSWDLKDPNTSNRIEIWGTYLRLIEDHPCFGVGLKNTSREALKYRGNSKYLDWAYQHAHNNFLQIAAERGIPGLILWLWFMIRLGWDALKIYRISRISTADSREALTSSLAALGSLTALLIAGTFEYNFGDSEILTLFLFLAGAPYAFFRKTD